MKLKVFKCFIVVFFLLSRINVLAQTIHGKVLASDDNKPLIGATIKIISRDSLCLGGMSTDGKGYFSGHIKENEFKLEISYHCCPIKI